tara:strand:- start:2212 stop:2532 length:321 start_codon:yes stop_codon:yes gene_type:complete
MRTDVSRPSAGTTGRTGAAWKASELPSIASIAALVKICAAPGRQALGQRTVVVSRGGAGTAVGQLSILHHYYGILELGYLAGWPEMKAGRGSDFGMFYNVPWNLYC